MHVPPQSSHGWPSEQQTPEEHWSLSLHGAHAGPPSHGQSAGQVYASSLYHALSSHTPLPQLQSVAQDPLPSNESHTPFPHAQPSSGQVV